MLLSQTIRPNSIKGYMLADSTIDSSKVNAVFKDWVNKPAQEGWDVVADTTALKALTVTTPGTRYYLKQLSSTNTNGGGEFVYFSSGYTANGVTVFAASGGGYFVRKEYLDSKVIDAEWA
ncbi:MAG: hypothetical protein CUN57_03230, partial [Phototrophicales bacterium]